MKKHEEPYKKKKERNQLNLPKFSAALDGCRDIMADIYNP